MGIQRNFAEIQFHVDTDIEDVKFRVYSHTGTKPEFMQLVLHGVTLEDGTKLGMYGPNNHEVLEVIDHDPDSFARNGGLDDVSQVERYRMSDEDYDKLPNTYRKFKAEQLAKDPNWVAPWVRKEREAAQARRAARGPMERLEDVQKRFEVGQRCEVHPGARRGVVAYIGHTDRKPITNLDGSVDLPQVFIGVKFDEPVGRNDGSAKGVRYFDAGRNYGSFVAPQFVTVGDFPERDPFASDDDEGEETAAHGHSAAHGHGCCGGHAAAEEENIDEEL